MVKSQGCRSENGPFFIRTSIEEFSPLLVSQSACHFLLVILVTLRKGYRRRSDEIKVAARSRSDVSDSMRGCSKQVGGMSAHTPSDR